MCQIKVVELEHGLWTVSVKRCFLEPTRAEVVAAPSHTREEAVAVGEELIKQFDCAVNGVDVQPFIPPKGIFG